MRRHRVGIASHAALTLAVGAVAAYAISAQGYRSHETELNDGGIWVVNEADGIHGRINKPINQLDTAVFTDDAKVPLDVLQQGAAVVGVDERAGVASTIDPAASRLVPGMQAAVPRGGQIEMYGDTLAAADPATGRVWAVDVDSRLGKPDISGLDRQSDPLDTAGKVAALTVTAGGDVVVTSAEKRTVLRMDKVSGRFAPADEVGLPQGAGDPTQASAVGEQVVTLDQAAGILHVLDGHTVEVPEGSVLQQPGPAAGSVLVGTPSELLVVDLDTGKARVVTEGVSGRPAEPVRLGACVYGAWAGGTGHVAVRCDPSGPVDAHPLRADASDLAFRVNRQQIVLNDSPSGAVWDLDEKPVRIDNWDAFTSTRLVDATNEKDEQKSDGDRRPPRAEPDDYGVRPGQTVILHPLDNDSAPEGRLLSIVAVDQPDIPRSQVTISPDGQTLQLTVPEDMARGTSFEYHIDDGRGLDASALVTVDPRGAGQNAPPRLREGHEDRTWRVAHSGTIAVPVLADWRDDADSDAVVVDSVQTLGGGPDTADARVTPDGRIRFSAGKGREGGRVQVGYSVSDGHGGVTAHDLAFDVQGYDEYTPYAPVAEPDVARGEVGQPITVRPLLNDLPGADPAHPDAVLELGGEVAQQPGLDVVTDLVAGEITVRAERPGTFFLAYDAAYGNSPLDGNKIRVDVRPRPKSDLDPVAMPDSLTVYGQDPAMVDVLANDLDPAGGLLAVQGASAESDQVDVAIVANRWLRISAADGTLDPDPQAVNYTISNGTVSGIEGQVTVDQRPEPEDSTPITATDRAVVRAGSAVAAPVLDNDVSPTGDKLSLVTDLVGGAPGELEVGSPPGFETDPGRAFVSGRVVRFVAPQQVAERTTMSVPYVAADSSGSSATGTLRVTVVPVDAGNSPPEPPQLDGRTDAGGEITLRIPGNGVDPDGDAVTVTGIETAPQLGRIVELGANGVTYQAFPGSTGTDEFRYTVTDSRGASASGTARIVVMPSGPPQQPLAVDDRVVVAPGRTIRVDAIANDFVGTGEGVEVDLPAPSGIASYHAEVDLVTVRTPRDPQAPSSQVVYTVDNGLARDQATITVQTQEGYNNPPVVHDAYGVADDSEAVSIDVLEGAYDPDGPAAKLRIVDVYHPTATFTDTRVKVDRRGVPQVVAFRVEDADGGAAVASLYVPATGGGVPYVKDDAFIEVDTNGTVRGKLSEHVVNPTAGPMRLVGRDAASAAPAEASARVVDPHTFELSGSSDYIGPGALLLRVTTAPGRDAADDTSPAGEAVTTLLSIPAQIGRPKPVLTCPEVPFEVAQDDRITLDIPSLCNVFTADPDEADDLAYDVQWVDQPPGLSLSEPLPGRVVVSAAGGARAGSEAVVVVRAGDSEPQQVRIRVVRAPSPRLLPVAVPDVKPGESRTVDLAQYLQPGVADPEPTLLSVQKVRGGDSTAQKSGNTRVTVRGGDEGGRVVFRVVMSDVSDPDAGPERRAEGLLEFEVGAVPDALTAVRAGEGDEPTEMRIWWPRNPDDNGSQITRYVVKNLNTGDTSACAGNGCTVQGLKGGRSYRFRVAAVNKFGQGAWSPASVPSIAGDFPGPPTGIRLVSRSDRSITVGWRTPAYTGGTDIIRYVVTVGGRTVRTADGNQRTVTVPELANNRRHPVTVYAVNGIGKGPTAERNPGWHPLGKPATPQEVRSAEGTPAGDSTSVQVSWSPAAANGPGATRYTVTATRNGRDIGVVGGCSKVSDTSCAHGPIAYDGAAYDYQVVAFNNPEHDNPGGGEAPAASDPGRTTRSFEAVGTPAAWGAWHLTATGENNELRIDGAVVPDARGARGTVQVIVDGQVQDRFEAGGGQSIDGSRALVRTSDNQHVANVQLRLCNEHARCSDSADEEQSYGRITREHVVVEALGAQKGDQSARWSVTTNGNGRPVTLHYRINGGATVTNARPASTQQTTVTFDTGGHNKRAQLEAWLTDATNGRNTPTVETNAWSGQPQDLGVGASVGADCGPTTGVECDGGGGWVDQCNGTTACNNLTVSVSGWWDDASKSGDAVRCTAQKGLRTVSRELAGNGQFTLGSFPRDGGTVQVDCRTTNRDVEQAGSGSTPWPDDSGGGGGNAARTVAGTSAWGP